MRLFIVWLVAGLLAVHVLGAEVYPLKESASFEQDIRMGKIAARSERAIEMLLKVGAAELKKRGYVLEAASMLSEWDQEVRYQFRSFAVMSSRDIGDHKPLSKWLDEKYMLMETVLGVQVCKATHLADLRTFNSATPVVFRPCSFPMDGVSGERIDEYVRHFNEGYIYGLIPVTGYWGTYFLVTAGTAGTGWSFISGLVASIAEKAISLVGDDAGRFIYNKFCGGK